MHLHSTTGASRYEAHILDRLSLVHRLAWKYSGGSADLVEELYSIGVMAMCEAAASFSGSEPGAYLYKAAKNAMVDELRRLHRLPVVSLDVPLGDSLFLADILPADDRCTSPSTKRSQALHSALLRLSSPRQRAVLRRRFGLAGYGSHSLQQTVQVLGLTLAKVDHAGRDGLKQLRNDVRLCKVVGVHHGC